MELVHNIAVNNQIFAIPVDTHLQTHLRLKLKALRIYQKNPLSKRKGSLASLSVTKLEVDIDVGTDNKPYKLGEVMGTLNSEQQIEDDFISAEPPTKEEMLDSIREESKTLRGKK